MPASSKSQQRLMGMVDQCKKTGDCASSKIEKIANSMKSKDVKKFAKTKHKGLPEKVKEHMTFKDFMLGEQAQDGFSVFMAAVDKLLEDIVGIGHDHLEDWVWMSAYEDEYTPQDAVNAFMEETGMDMY